MKTHAIVKAHSYPAPALLDLPKSAVNGRPDLLGLLFESRVVEAFLDTATQLPDRDEFDHRIAVFRGKPGGQATLIGAFLLRGGPGSSIRFFQPPNSKDAAVVLIGIMGTLDWSSVYLIGADRKSWQKLFTAYDVEFADLNNDGTCALIAWNRRPFDLRCGFNTASAHFYPEVFVPSGDGYTKAWPPPGWLKPGSEDQANSEGSDFQIVAGFARLQPNDVAQLVVLQDRMQREPEQSLAVYRLGRSGFDRVAATALPAGKIAFLIPEIRDSSGQKQIVVRAATPEKCRDAGGIDDRGTSESAFVLNGSKLQSVIR